MEVVPASLIDLQVKIDMGNVPDLSRLSKFEADYRAATVNGAVRAGYQGAEPLAVACSYPKSSCVHAASNVTGKASKPRKAILFRQTRESDSRARFRTLRIRVVNAICPSTRASGAPKQK